MPAKTTKKTAQGVILSIKVAPETKAMVVELAQLISKDLGTTVNMTQAVEIAISEATSRRKEKLGTNA